MENATQLISLDENEEEPDRITKDATDLSDKSNESLSSSSTSLENDIGRSDHYNNGILLNIKDGENSNADSDKFPTRNIPPFNVPEKIILCIDISCEENQTPFKCGNNHKVSAFHMMKRVIEFFVFNKNSINEEHEFAIIALKQGSVSWVRDFTNDLRSIFSTLNDLENCPEGDVFDLSQLFDLIKDHVKLPVVEESDRIPPPYVVRTILVYTRSNCLPEFISGRECYNWLMASDYFTLDVLYLYEETLEKNKFQEIINLLRDLDDKGFSYFFTVSRNQSKLHADMAKLLSHPLQRPIQRTANYTMPILKPDMYELM